MKSPAILTNKISVPLNDVVKGHSFIYRNTEYRIKKRYVIWSLIVTVEYGRIECVKSDVEVMVEPKGFKRYCNE